MTRRTFPHAVRCFSGARGGARGSSREREPALTCLESSTIGQVLLHALGSLIFQRAYEVGITVIFIYQMRKRRLRKTEATRSVTGRLPPHCHVSSNLVSQHMVLSSRLLYRPTSLWPTQNPESGTQALFPSLDRPAQLRQIPDKSNSVERHRLLEY